MMMGNNRRHNRNNNYRPPTIILAALLASTLSLPKAVSAHGREGRDREKMSALLQSLFEMKEARARITPLGTVDLMIPAATGATGLETWVPSGSPSALEEGGGGLGGAWSGPSRMQAGAPLSHPSPPSEPFHIGLLRVTGAKASGSPAAPLGSATGGAGRRRAAAGDSPAMLRGEAPDDGGGKHDFVRDLRRQFELRQQRAQAKE
jgi:hypothetical protein